MRWGPVLLVIVLATPVASAAQVRGTLEVIGPFMLPPGSEITSAAVALFMNASDASSGSIAMDAPALEVRVYEDRLVVDPVLGPRPVVVIDSRRPVWAVHDAEVDVAVEAGWLGVHAMGGLLRETAEAPAQLRAAREGIGNGRSTADAPDQPFYFVPPGDELVLRTSSRWTYEGSALAKLSGPTLTIRSAENTTTIRTGEFADPERPGTSIRRWVALYASDLAIVVEDAPTAVASSRVLARWDGEAHAVSASGEIAGDLRSWTVTGDPVRLDGALHATVDAGADAGALSVALEGDLRTSSAKARLAQPAMMGSDWLPLFLVAAALVAGAATYATIRRPRGAATSPDAEQCIALAEAAADRDDYAEAAHWAQIARAKSPSSKRIALDHAYYVATAGDRDRALGLLQSPLLARDPDALLLLARTLAASSHADEAAGALMRALHAAPILVLGVEDDPQLADILARPDVRRARHDAHAKLR